ncbi:MAG: MBL fold metallo-hydrolase [Chitinophagaceae bacterium]|nr:MAG: MBL fold metallo-hydrolase [Chitinophagaceae bacterium]
MKIIPLSEGCFTIDSSKEFIPFDEHKHLLVDRPKGSLLVEIQPFVVITKNDIIIIDTGLGIAKNGRPQIHQNLMNVGINSSEVTKVLLSHLHKDHAGGILKKQSIAELNFPNATYFVHEKEFENAFSTNSASYNLDELNKLKSSSKLCLLKDENGAIENYIEYKITGAHSIYHQVFWIREEGQIAFFGGDDAPQLQQMKHRFIAKYDYGGRKAMELRKEWWEKGLQEKWTFMFYHDIKNPVWNF